MKLRFVSAFKTVLPSPDGKVYVGVQLEDDKKHTWTYWGLTKGEKNYRINVSTSIENRVPSAREVSEVYNEACRWFEKTGHPFTVDGDDSIPSAERQSK